MPLADPFIMLDGDTYYAYGTHDANGIEVWTSKDLLGWSKLDALALKKDNTTEQQWFWAPEVYHKNDKYYMYFSANEHLFVATASSPRGPFKQVGGYMMEPLIGSEKCIDSSVFFDDNGQAYCFFVRFTDGNCIWMCQLDDDLVTPVEGILRKCINVSQSWENKQGRVNEGPFIWKNNNIYYLTYSGNDYRSQDYAVGYAMRRSLSTTGGATPSWQKYANNPIVRRVENLVGIGHHSLFTDKEGRLRIVFHAHHSESVVAPPPHVHRHHGVPGQHAAHDCRPHHTPYVARESGSGDRSPPLSLPKVGTTGGRFSWHGWTYDLLGRRVAL